MSDDALLRFEKLTVCRGPRTLLNTISASFFPGEFVAMVGENGCGKSSLLATLSGTTDSTPSDIWFQGHALQQFSATKLAQWRAVMQQSPATPFGFVTAEVLELARYRIVESPAHREQCINQVAAWFEIAHLLTRNIQSLSGGERQRVFLAKTLLQILPDPDLEKQTLKGRMLLLDEPTSALDLRHQKIVMETLSRLAKAGLCIICVSHDINLITPYCNRMLVLGEQRCLADAPPCEALTKEILAQCFHTQLQLLKNEHHTVFVTH